MELLELKLKSIFLEYLFVCLRESVGKGRPKALGIGPLYCFFLFLPLLCTASKLLCIIRMMSSCFRCFLVSFLFFPVKKGPCLSFHMLIMFFTKWAERCFNTSAFAYLQGFFSLSCG